MLNIGKLQINSNFLLAPMSGVTDYPYREIVKKFKPGLVFSEMIASRALLSRNSKTMKMIKKTDNFLSAVQIAGCDPEIMAEASKICEDNGADIIDIGGESTRPGSKTIHPKIEWKRIQFMVKNFKKKFKNTCVSVDTRKSEVIQEAIKHNVDLINDVSGFSYDKESIKKLKKYKIPKVLHHMQGTPKTMQKNPKYKNVLLDIYDFFQENINFKLKNKDLILDPGIGFGKTLKHNLTLISKISLFHSLGFPILIGTSRKRFINQISGINDSEDRIGGTLASVLYLLSQGVQLFRIHNVNEVKQGILVYEEILSN